MNPDASLSTDERRAGFLAGAVIGGALAARTADVQEPALIARALDADPLPLAPPSGRRPAGTALADALLAELLEGGVDLQRLTTRWIEWWRSDGLDADPVLIEALAHLQQFDAPTDSLEGGTAVILAATLPAALAASSPGSMVAGTFHTARLLDPNPATGLAAVAVVMAAARCLEGQRDFMGDILAMLRTNGAPEAFFEAMRSVPLDPRSPPPIPRGPTVTAVAAAPWLLWQLHHRPRGEEILRGMVARGGVASPVGAVLGALVGARDGLDRWPRSWLEGAGEDVTLRLALAERLAVDQ